MIDRLAGRRGLAVARGWGEFTLTTEILYLDDGQGVTIYRAKPGTRDHGAMRLLSLVADTPDLPC